MNFLKGIADWAIKNIGYYCLFLPVRQASKDSQKYLELSMTPITNRYILISLITSSVELLLNEIPRMRIFDLVICLISSKNYEHYRTSVKGQIIHLNVFYNFLIGYCCHVNS